MLYILYLVLVTIDGGLSYYKFPLQNLSEACVRIIINSLLILAVSISLSSCNTFEGIGKDIKKSGKSIEDTAKDCK